MTITLYGCDCKLAKIAPKQCLWIVKIGARRLQVFQNYWGGGQVLVSATGLNSNEYGTSYICTVYYVN
jgi:hypothetical protein